MGNIIPGALLVALLTHLAGKKQGPPPKDGGQSADLNSTAPGVVQAAMNPNMQVTQQQVNADNAAHQPQQQAPQPNPQGAQQAVSQLQQVMGGQPAPGPGGAPMQGMSQDSILKSLGLHIA